MSLAVSLVLYRPTLKYLIVYHLITLYFSVLLPIVYKYFIMHCVYELYGFYRHVSGCLCPLSLMLK